MKPEREIEVGDPLVLQGNKYRLRQIVESAAGHAVYLVADPPNRLPTHRVEIRNRNSDQPSPVFQDRKVGVYRVAAGYLVSLERWNRGNHARVPGPYTDDGCNCVIHMEKAVALARRQLDALGRRLDKVAPSS